MNSEAHLDFVVEVLGCSGHNLRKSSTREQMYFVFLQIQLRNFLLLYLDLLMCICQCHETRNSALYLKLKIRY